MRPNYQISLLKRESGAPPRRGGGIGAVSQLYSELVWCMVKTRLLVLVLVFLTFSHFGLGQNVRSLREQSTDLPQSAADREVLNLFFGAISAVQDGCGPALVESLRAENALAACATYGTSFGSTAELTRQMVELEFMVPLEVEDRGAWLTPWRNNSDFGTVRELVFGDSHYFLALDDASGIAYVIKFLE